MLLPELGIKPLGLSPFTATYMQLQGDKHRTDHVIYDAGVRVIPNSGAKIFARIAEPCQLARWNHFSSHFQTPPDKLTKYAAATVSGRAGYINFPIFGAIARHGSPIYRTLLRNLIEHLMPEPLLIIDGPTSLESSIMRQKKPVSRTIVHLLQYSPERRAENIDLIEDIVPIQRVPLSLKFDRKPKSVYLAPDGVKLDYEYEASRVSLIVPEIHGHAMIVFE